MSPAQDNTTLHFVDLIEEQIKNSIQDILDNDYLVDLIKKQKPELLQIGEKRSIDSEISGLLSQTEKADSFKVSAELSNEERDSIFKKLSRIAQQPVGQISEIDVLYFEQQLSDMLGMTVTAELDQHQLPFSIAQAKAMPHLPTSHNNQLTDHLDILEAGMSFARPSFGFSNKNLKDLENYGVSLPLMALADWTKNREQILEWYKYRSILVINPLRRKAAVGAVINVAPAYQHRFQVGLSPELIRSLQAWHPLSHGKVVMMFVDSNKKVKLGPLDDQLLRLS